MIPADFISQLKVLYPKRDGGQVWSAVARLAPGNIEPLCRRCHMERDGRMAKVRQWRKK